MTNRKRWLSRASVVLVLLIVGLISGRAAAPAQAADLCKDAPEILRPDVGTAGIFLPKPDLATVPDRPADPWADINAKFVDVYGTSASFFTYDLGCGPAVLNEAPAVINMQTAQLAFQDVNAWVAFLNAMEVFAKDMDLGWLASSVDKVSEGVRHEALTNWLPVTLLAAGLIIIWSAHRQDYAATARNVGIIALCLALAYLCLQVPSKLIGWGDDAVTKIGKVADQNLSGSATDAVWRSSVLPMWTVATLGTQDTPMARQYAPRIWESTHYTWADIKRMQNDPEGKIKEEIDDGKHERFKTAAKEIKERDPAAYEYVRGTAGGRPIAQAYVQTAGTSAFVAVAFIMVILARFMMVAMVIMGMFAAIAGVIPTARTQGMLRSLWDLFTANLVAVFKFSVAAKIVTLLMHGVVASSLNGGGKLLSMLIITVAAFVLTKPLRTFKTMVPGAKPEKGFSMLKRGLASALGAAAGAKAGSRTTKKKDKDEEEDEKDESTQQDPNVTRHATDSMPALERVKTSPNRVNLTRTDDSTPQSTSWEGLANNGKPAGDQPARAVSFARVAGELPAAPDRGRTGDTGGITEEAEPKRWRITSAGSVERDPRQDMEWWAPGGGSSSPAADEQVRFPGQAAPLPPAVVRSRPALVAAPSAPGHRSASDGSGVAKGDVPPSAPQPNASAPRPSSTRAMVNLRGEHLTAEQLRNVEVIEGEVIEDPTMYRSQKESTVSSAEYVRLPEPVLGPDGTETRSVTYVSSKGSSA